MDVVGPFHVELDLGTGVAVGQPQLGLIGGQGTEPLHQLREMLANS